MNAIPMIRQCSAGQAQKPGSHLYDGTDWCQSRVRSDSEGQVDIYIDLGHGTAMRYQPILKLKVDYYDG